MNGLAVQNAFKSILKNAISQLVNVQNKITANSHIPGCVGKRPFSNRAGLFKIIFVCTSSLYIGGFIAHKGASYLEENEIFVPADEDDDD